MNAATRRKTRDLARTSQDWYSCNCLLHGIHSGRLHCDHRAVIDALLVAVEVMVGTATGVDLLTRNAVR